MLVIVLGPLLTSTFKLVDLGRNFYSLQQHGGNLYVLGLKIQRMSLTGGTSPVEYLEAFKITLFLTSEEKDVKEALRRGKENICLCLIMTSSYIISLL